MCWLTERCGILSWAQLPIYVNCNVHKHTFGALQHHRLCQLHRADILHLNGMHHAISPPHAMPYHHLRQWHFSIQ